MRTFTDHGLTVIAFDANVWLQERNLLRVTDEQSQAGEPINLYRVTGTTTTRYTLISTYSTDSRGEVIIDLSDYIRVHAKDTDRRVAIENRVGNNVIIDFTAAGLINPTNVLIPQNSMRIPVLVSFPSVCFLPIDNVPTIFELRGVPAGSGWEAGSYDGNFEEGANEIPNSVSLFNYGDMARNHGSKVLNPLECNKTYAAVRWVSFTGATRCHTWEVVRSKTETSSAFELETADGSYNTVKGRVDGFSLRLDGLNDYDYWYYSDVCHSSSVEVSLDGVTWQRVDVTTKGVTIPDGNAGKLNTLIVELNYRKYDAVTM